jgi:hypothetical protein
MTVEGKDPTSEMNVAFLLHDTSNIPVKLDRGQRIAQKQDMQLNILLQLTGIGWIWAKG